MDQAGKRDNRHHRSLQSFTHNVLVRKIPTRRMPKSVTSNPKDCHAQALHQLKLRNARSLLQLLKDTAALQSRLLEQISNLLEGDGKRPPTE